MRWPSCAMLVAAGLLAASCGSNGRNMVAPEPPAALTPIDEYPFGDTIAAADERAIGHVVDPLISRYGHPVITRYTMPASTDLNALRARYDDAARSAGWRRLPQIGAGLPPSERAFGYIQGDTILAIITLAPREDSATLPVNVVRLGA